MSNNIKLYKNPNRDKKDNFVPYIPQYKLKNISVENLGGTVDLSFTKQNDLPLDNQRAARLPIRQPYAVAENNVGIEKISIPNVGNNMENTWSAIDDYIVDDISINEKNIDLNHKMVDNNNVDKIDVKNDNNILTILNDLEVNNYLLIVNNDPVCSGDLQYIETQARDIVFGEHNLYIGEQVSIEDILVIKKTKIKIGVFLE